MRSEIVRKTLHIMYVLSILLALRSFSAWYHAALAIASFALVVCPILPFIERFPLYKRILAERRSGEVKTRLVEVTLMSVILIAVFWGWLGSGWKYTIAVAVAAWGFGDAAAALVGKACGRHRIRHRIIEGKKTVEGTLAMYAVSCLAVFVTTMVYAAAPWYHCLAVALLVAPVCAAVELLSRRGVDNITVPFSAAISTVALISLFTFLGK